MLVVLVMRKRIQLVVQLFREAGKAIASMPILLLQPILVSDHFQIFFDRLQIFMIRYVLMVVQCWCKIVC